MGRFANLTLGKGKEITIGDETFEIKPLTGKHLGLFMELGDGKNNKAMYELILASLQQTDSSIKKEDIEELPLGVLTKVMEAIMDVNELQ